MFACILTMLFGAAALRAFVFTDVPEGVGGPYSLIDGRGRSVTQADFRGRHTLIYFGYTHCIDACPLTLATVSDVLEALGEQSRAIVPIFISVDPARDTPQAVQRYVSQFSPRIVGLTGSRAQLEPVLKRFHVMTRRGPSMTDGNYLIDHHSVLYLMDGRNRLVHILPADSSTQKLVAELRHILPPAPAH